MADTKDRRSEGKTSSTLVDKKRRLIRNTRKAIGICVQCGKTAVAGRSYCYSCSDRAVKYQRASGFRTFCRDNKVDIDEQIEFLTMMLEQSKSHSEHFSMLVSLFEAAKSKR